MSSPASSPQPAAARKVCTLCGVDCAGKPRVKDQHGRYFCEPCHAKIEAKAAAKAARVAAPAGPAAAAPPVPEAAPALAQDDGLLALVETIPVAPAAPPSRCDGCGMPRAAESTICTRCGFNKATGKVVDPTADEEEDERPRKKAKKKAAPAEKRWKSARDYDEEESRYERRMAYLKPGITMAVCVLTFCGVAAAKELEVPLILVLFGCSVVGTFLAYLAIAVAWVGFDEPLHIEGLRVAAVVSLAMIPEVLMMSTPLGGTMASRLIVWGVFLIGCYVIMELEQDEAAVMGILGGITKVVSFFLALYFLRDYF